MRNPFELVYGELAAMVFADPRIQAQVRPGNAINYMQLHSQSPEKETLESADLPQVVLVSSGAAFNLHATSNSTSCTRRYQWMIATDGFQLQPLAAIEWGILCAMVEWRSRLTRLTWPEGLTEPHNHFVKGLRSPDISEALLPAQFAKGIAGWNAIWTCEVDMYFRSDDLKQFSIG